MPNPNMASIRPHPLSRFRCPCGFEGTIGQLAAHRRGWTKRPQCHGKNVLIWDAKEHLPEPSPKEEAAESPKPVEPMPSPQLPSLSLEVSPQEIASPLSPSPPPSAFESVPSLESDSNDPEMVARMLNLQRQQQAAPPGDGNGGGITDLSEFVAEPAVSPPSVSENRIVVLLPVQIQIMYDWARAMGWFQGDGTIAAFITDFMMDHFNHCLGMALVVVRREEVGL